MFNKKTWIDRETEFPNRREIREIDTTTGEAGEPTLAYITRSEGAITAAGDPYSSDNMNNLETRIYNECDAIEQMLGPVQGATVTQARSVGEFFVHHDPSSADKKPIFYEVTQAIPDGGTIQPDVNCKSTKVSRVLTALKTQITSAVNTLTSRVNGIAQTQNYHAQAIYNIQHSVLNEFWVARNNVAISSGGTNITVDTSGRIVSGIVYGVVVTARGVADVYGATILDATPRQCQIHVHNLSNPTYTGSVDLFIVFMGGDAL